MRSKNQLQPVHELNWSASPLRARSDLPPALHRASHAECRELVAWERVPRVRLPRWRLLKKIRSNDGHVKEKNAWDSDKSTKLEEFPYLEIYTNVEISTGNVKNSRHNCARKKKSAKKSENGDEKSARRVTAAHVTRPQQQQRRAVTARVDIARVLLLQDMVALKRTRGMFTFFTCQMLKKWTGKSIPVGGSGDPNLTLK